MNDPGKKSAPIKKQKFEEPVFKLHVIEVEGFCVGSVKVKEVKQQKGQIDHWQKETITGDSDNGWL